jgi:hypothetical protein
MKVLRVILVAVAGVAVVSIGVLVGMGRYFRYVSAETTTQAEEFAAHATHAECADEVARRTRVCGESSYCTLEALRFSHFCFKEARGDLAQFCAGVPASGDWDAREKWEAGFCPPRELAMPFCGLVTTEIVMVCARARGSVGDPG